MTDKHVIKNTDKNTDKNTTKKTASTVINATQKDTICEDCGAVLDLGVFQEEYTALQDELHGAREAERRALADYQNLVRRNQEERAAYVKYATQDLVQSLLEPLAHLDLAAQQIADTGLTMVTDQLWQKLSEAGLEKVDVLGKEFDVELMEAVEKNGSAAVVTAVHRPAYRLNGQVIQHARVVMGDKT